jgi:hypothetical protein
MVYRFMGPRPLTRVSASNMSRNIWSSIGSETITAQKSVENYILYLLETMENRLPVPKSHC